MMAVDAGSLSHPERGWFWLFLENKETRDKEERQGTSLPLRAYDHSSFLPFLLPLPSSLPLQRGVGGLACLLFPCL